jgi:two-component system cell cycle response regulator CtrA
MHILVVEDDPATSRSLELLLTRADMKPYATSSGADAVELAKLYDYDLIVLDLGLPDLSGHEVLRRLRCSDVQTPVLILSGDDATQSKLKGFGSGADDYLTKPFQSDELLARVHAIVRRSRRHARSTVRIGRLSIDLNTKAVAVDGQRVPLTGKEYQILELLSLRLRTTITKEVFLDQLYGGMDEPEPKVIDVFICKLRRKLAAALGHDSPIETIRGLGYVLRDPEPVKSPGQASAA